ncbi:MAG: ABC transporter permease [Flammeovirgaceae bacterium]|nr:ABC transporter permease [Flammeovirgaceae bacterium]
MMTRNTNHINRWLHLLEWACPPSLYEGIEGDLLEQYELDTKTIGESKAKRKFIWAVIKFLRPGIILRNRFTVSIISTIMIGNYFKVAGRNIRKRKFYSFINAFGLSIGLAFCMLIGLYIQDEKEFDQFHENKSSIYRIEEKSFDTWKHDSDDPYSRSAWIQTGLGPALKDELPEVKYATRYNSDNRGIFRYEEKVFTESLTYVDADFFKMFSFPLIKGNADRIFLDKSEIVLTPAIVKKYFGDVDPIGKTILIDDEGEKSYTVTGVIEPAPANSSLHYDILISQENRSYYERNMNNWGNFNTPTFVQLNSEADLTIFKTNLDKIIDKYMRDKLEKWRKESTIQIPTDVKMLEYEFTALPDWHLEKEIRSEMVSDPQYSIILGGIAIFIMLLACINYISLSLTTSASRRIEVGVRKVVGAQRNQLVYQFSFESLMLSLASMVIGFGLVVLFFTSL